MFLLLVIVVVLFLLYRLQKSNEWIEIQAEIQEVTVQENIVKENNIKSVDYIVDLSFKYTIDYKEYIGTKIYAGLPNVFTDKNDLDTFLQNNAVWTKVIAYYDYNNPEDSALLRVQIPYFAIVLIITVILWIWYGILQVNKLMWD
jgi:hypothetical protein